MVGHAAAEQAFVHAATAGQLAPAWLITGPPGIGKATLAFRLARFLLVRDQPANAATPVPALSTAASSDGDGVAVPPTHPVFRRIAGGTHADLLTIERSIDPKRKRRRNDIVVDDVRAIRHFLSSTAAEGIWRVVIVDPVDDMNRQAANAILKILEEPPAGAVLLLTSNSAAAVPATIRSRCRRLALRPLPAETVVGLLQRYRPDLPPDDATAIAEIANGSIGFALMLADANAVVLHAEIKEILAGLPDLDLQRVSRLCDTVAALVVEEPLVPFRDILCGWIAEVIAVCAGAVRRSSYAADAGLLARLATAGQLDRWLEVWENLTAVLVRGNTASMDARQVVLAALAEIVPPDRR
jgi:DNA polymerase-3 subunit delta'